jgi:hypothetical protein
VDILRINYENMKSPSNHWCFILLSILFVLVRCEKDAQGQEFELWNTSLDIRKAKRLSDWFMPTLHTHTLFEGRHRLVRLKKFYTLDVSPSETKYRIVCDVEIKSEIEKNKKKEVCLVFFVLSISNCLIL